MSATQITRVRPSWDIYIYIYIPTCTCTLVPLVPACTCTVVPLVPTCTCTCTVVPLVPTTCTVVPLVPTCTLVPLQVLEPLRSLAKDIAAQRRKHMASGAELLRQLRASMDALDRVSVAWRPVFSLEYLRHSGPMCL